MGAVCKSLNCICVWVCVYVHQPARRESSIQFLFEHNRSPIWRRLDNWQGRDKKQNERSKLRLGATQPGFATEREMMHLGFHICFGLEGTQRKLISIQKGNPAKEPHRNHRKPKGNQRKTKRKPNEYQGKPKENLITMTKDTKSHPPVEGNRPFPFGPGNLQAGGFQGLGAEALGFRGDVQAAGGEAPRQGHQVLTFGAAMPSLPCDRGEKWKENWDHP